jgi:hypothetical protein
MFTFRVLCLCEGVCSVIYRCGCALVSRSSFGCFWVCPLCVLCLLSVQRRGSSGLVDDGFSLPASDILHAIDVALRLPPFLCPLFRSASVSPAAFDPPSVYIPHTVVIVPLDLAHIHTSITHPPTLPALDLYPSYYHPSASFNNPPICTYLPRIYPAPRHPPSSTPPIPIPERHVLGADDAASIPPIVFIRPAYYPCGFSSRIRVFFFLFI